MYAGLDGFVGRGRAMPVAWLASLWLLVAASNAAALQLTLQETIDVGGIFFAFEDKPAALAFEDATGSLWVAESAIGGAVFEMDPSTGQFLSVLDPADSLGIQRGADAVAIDPSNGNLALFSAFGESIGGVVAQSNQVVATYADSRGAAAAQRSRRPGSSGLLGPSRPSSADSTRRPAPTAAFFRKAVRGPQKTLSVSFAATSKWVP